MLHQVSVEKNLGVTGLLKWLVDQRDPNRFRSETHQLRLESDNPAVNIMTIHKSKGLEFEVVFCPFLWEGLRHNGAEVVFHIPEDDDQAAVDFGSNRYDDHKIIAQNELLYPAVTRARKSLTIYGREPVLRAAISRKIHRTSGLRDALRGP